MAKVYSWRFHTRTYELGKDGLVRPSVLQSYCEEAATQASASNGYDFDWYMANQRVWVARKITLRYFEPARYRDHLELHTWVSDFRRVQSHREYDLRRVSDGASILRARTNWVYLDSITMRPARLPEDFFEAFKPSGELETLDVGVTDPQATTIDVQPQRITRYAQASEIDSAGIVNNANYVRWTDDAIAATLRDGGWSAARLAVDGLSLIPISHEVEYLRSALEGNCVHIDFRPRVFGGNRVAWHTQIRDANSGDMLTEDTATYAFEREGQPVDIPSSFLDAVFVR